MTFPVVYLLMKGIHDTCCLCCKGLFMFSCFLYAVLAFAFFTMFFPHCDAHAHIFQYESTPTRTPGFLNVIQNMILHPESCLLCYLSPGFRRNWLFWWKCSIGCILSCLFRCYFVAQNLSILDTFKLISFLWYLVSKETHVTFRLRLITRWKW